jgi:hypothetical protein
MEVFIHFIKRVVWSTIRGRIAAKHMLPGHVFFPRLILWGFSELKFLFGACLNGVGIESLMMIRLRDSKLFGALLCGHQSPVFASRVSHDVLELISTLSVYLIV